MSENKPSQAVMAGSDYKNHAERIKNYKPANGDISHPKAYPPRVEEIIHPITKAPHLVTLSFEHPGEAYLLHQAKVDLRASGKPASESFLEKTAVREYGLKKIIKAGSYDPLCLEKGIEFLNRGGVMERLKQAIAEKVRSGKGNITLMFADIDHFKQVNDLYGHQAGDAVIRALADSLKTITLRGTDSEGRYGGEEFVAFFIDMPFLIAKQKGLLLQEIFDKNQNKAVASENDYGKFPNLKTNKTLSIGIATVEANDPRLKDPDFINVLLQEAIHAEHIAKLTRNTVVIMRDGKPMLVNPNCSETAITIKSEKSPEDQIKLRAKEEIARFLADALRNDLVEVFHKLDELGLDSNITEAQKTKIEEILGQLVDISMIPEELERAPDYRTTKTPGGKDMFDLEASMGNEKASDLPD